MNIDQLKTEITEALVKRKSRDPHDAAAHGALLVAASIALCAEQLQAIEFELCHMRIAAEKLTNPLASVPS